MAALRNGSAIDIFGMRAKGEAACIELANRIHHITVAAWIQWASGGGFRVQTRDSSALNSHRQILRGLTPAAMVRRFGKAPISCRSGGIGRRAGLKIR